VVFIFFTSRGGNGNWISKERKEFLLGLTFLMSFSFPNEEEWKVDFQRA
jgi:hypothetical protein